MTQFFLSPDAHHYLGIEANQQTWALLTQPERSEQDNRRMEHFALASLHHWQHSPHFTPVNAQRGHWLLARVYAVLSRGEESLHQAEACLALTEAHSISGLDRAYAHEAVARAKASLNHTEEAMNHLKQAQSTGGLIDVKEDMELFFQDLNDGPWFQLNVQKAIELVE